jgi:hypothetical protein
MPHGHAKIAVKAVSELNPEISHPLIDDILYRSINMRDIV